jgi:hypothetical protein
MSQEDLAAVLGVIGATFVLAAWIGRRTGDAARDVWLMFAAGGGLLAATGVLVVV